MAHSYAYDRASEKQKMSFQRSFMKDPLNFQVRLDGSEPVAEMHSKRSELRKMARGLLDVADKEKRSLTDAEKDSFEVISSMLDDVQLAFDTKQERSLIERSVSGTLGIVTRSDSMEIWEESGTGKKIPVLGKENRFQDFYKPQPGHDISSRDFFAGLVGHQNTPEVRASMATNFDGKGGYMVPDHISAEVIDLLRSKNTVIQAGARTIPLPAQNCRVCRVISDPVAGWTTENTLIPEDSSMEIGALEFHAHKMTCLIKASRELLQDASNAGTVIMNAISTAMAGELDYAALMGNGVGKPLGIFNAEGIGSYSLGENGATLNGFDDILYGVREIVTANGPIPTTGIMSPRTLVGYSLLKDGEGKPLVRPDLIKNMQLIDTTRIPVDQTQGNVSTCSSIILGGFDQLVIGIRSSLEIQVLNERYADEGKVGFLATMRADTACYQPKSFCKIIGIKP